MDSAPIVILENVRKSYALGKTKVEALRGVSFSLEKGDFVSIAGPSGSGKTTILNLIGCIDTPSEGRVQIDGVDLGALDDRRITALRHETIGFVFQSFNLIPVLNVYENIEFPLLLRNERASRKGRREWIESLIEEVGLGRWKKHRPNELSGGQRQRVAVARALATRPRIVLADEPTANLDSVTGETIIELMKKINREMGATFIFSTHDSKIVQIADHILRLHDGLLESEERTGRSNGRDRR